MLECEAPRVDHAPPPLTSISHATMRGTTHAPRSAHTLLAQQRWPSLTDGCTPTTILPVATTTLLEARLPQQADTLLSLQLFSSPATTTILLERPPPQQIYFRFKVLLLQLPRELLHTGQRRPTATNLNGCLRVATSFVVYSVHIPTGYTQREERATECPLVSRAAATHSPCSILFSLHCYTAYSRA
jgi:hypothetical protein